MDNIKPESETSETRENPPVSEESAEQKAAPISEAMSQVPPPQATPMPDQAVSTPPTPKPPQNPYRRPNLNSHTNYGYGNSYYNGYYGGNGAIPPPNPNAGYAEYWRNGQNSGSNHSTYGGNWCQNSTPQYQNWNAPPQMPPASDTQGKNQDKRDRRLTRWLKIASCLVALLLLYCIGSDIVAYRTGNYSTNGTAVVATGTTNVVIQQQSKPDLDTTETGVNEDGTYTVEGVAAAVRPSIVEIYTYADEDYTLVDGTGSGIIISEDGYIITNAHVITDGLPFSVVTSDETEYRAQVIGSDSKTDLAVIKIDATDLTAATLGDSDEVILGEAVVAIGNPAGLSGSVTNGIVSGLNRQIRSDSTGFDMNCIQTNAAISPGNSGGALVNMYGQVIGITSSKYVSSSYEGLGFAITINEVIPIVEDLISNGYVEGRVRVGITFISLESDEVQLAFAEELEMEDIPESLNGIWITEIAADCDISNTELAENDMIIEVNGQSVSTYDEVMAAIDGQVAGDSVEAVCRRYNQDDSYETFKITFALMEDTSGNY